MDNHFVCVVTTLLKNLLPQFMGPFESWFRKDQVQCIFCIGHGIFLQMNAIKPNKQAVSSRLTFVPSTKSEIGNTIRTLNAHDKVAWVDRVKVPTIPALVRCSSVYLETPGAHLDPNVWTSCGLPIFFEGCVVGTVSPGEVDWLLVSEFTWPFSPVA